MRINSMRALKALMCGTLLLASGTLFAAEADKGAEGATQTNWKMWHADFDIANRDQLQRGARNFANYCLGCHSLKYMRYSRMGQDLGIPPDLLNKYLVQPGDKDTNYILTTMPAADAEAWFGKTPPDLSLMARARGTDYLYGEELEGFLAAGTLTRLDLAFSRDQDAKVYVQHRMADMFIHLEQARSMAMLAAVKVSSSDAEERRRVVSAGVRLVLTLV